MCAQDPYERRGFYYYCSLSVYQGHWVRCPFIVPTDPTRFLFLPPHRRRFIYRNAGLRASGSEPRYAILYALAKLLTFFFPFFSSLSSRQIRRTPRGDNFQIVCETLLNVASVKHHTRFLIAEILLIQAINLEI